MISVICAILPATFGKNVEVFIVLGMMEICCVDWWFIPLIISKI